MPHDGELLQKLRPAIVSTQKLADSWDGDFHSFQVRHGDLVRETFDALTSEHHDHTNFPDAPFGHWHMHPFVVLSLFDDARLIWVDRPVADWIASLERWERSHPETYPHHERWDTHRKKVVGNRLKRRYMAELDVPTRCFRLHIDELGDYTALSTQLQVEAPSEPFPHVNRQSRVASLVRLGRKTVESARQRT